MQAIKKTLTAPEPKDIREERAKDIKKYYDPEYDRNVTEDVIQKQYEWFKQHTWFHKTYEEFRNDNFWDIDSETE